MRIETAEFTHKVNDSGSVDSYCSQCFVRVATSNSKTEVQTKEKEHKCDPDLLKLINRYKVASPFRSAA